MFPHRSLYQAQMLSRASAFQRKVAYLYDFIICHSVSYPHFCEQVIQRYLYLQLHQTVNKEKASQLTDLNHYLKKNNSTQGSAMYNYCLKFCVTSNSSKNNFWRTKKKANTQQFKTSRVFCTYLTGNTTSTYFMHIYFPLFEVFSPLQPPFPI